MPWRPGWCRTWSPPAARPDLPRTPGRAPEYRAVGAAERGHGLRVDGGHRPALAERQGGGGCFGARGERREDGADVHRRRGVMPSHRIASDPAGASRGVRRGRLPDVHAAEVAVIGFGVADTADDGELVVLPQRFHTGHRRFQPSWLSRCRPVPARRPAPGGRRDKPDGRPAQGVEPVVAPVHGEHDEYLGVGRQRVGLRALGQLMPGDPGRAGGECRSTGDPGRHRELAPIHPRHGDLQVRVLRVSGVPGCPGAHQCTMYSGELTAIATRVAGLATCGFRAATVRSDQRPTPSW